LTEVDAVVVSHDGSLGAIATQTQTNIVNLLNDQVVARVNSVVWPPLAFSWDDQLLVVDGGPKALGELVGAAGEQVATAQVNDTCGNVIQITQLDPYGRQRDAGRPSKITPDQDWPADWP
jgi:hypothetical protein